MKNTPSNAKRWLLPNRSTVLGHLEDLIAGRRSREEVSDWAGQFITGDYDHIRVTDHPAWELLGTLWGCDIIISFEPTESLYDKVDFGSWRNELRTANANG